MPTPFRPRLLRPALPDDAADVARLLIEVRRAFVPYAPLAHADDEVRSRVAERLVPAGGVTIAHEGDAVAGMIAVVAGDRAVPSWIEQMAVEPALVGRGIGTALLGHVLATLPHPVRLYTFQENAKARRFDERNGFQAIAFSEGAGNEERCPDVLLARRIGGCDRDDGSGRAP